MSRPCLPKTVHSWPKSPAKARKIQESLRRKVQIIPGPDRIDHVVGLDVSYPRDRSLPARVAAVVVETDSLQVVQEAVIEQDVDFPYNSRTSFLSGNTLSACCPEPAK
jgi:deoxyinosine 3'endonuclease (endonuclease V)